MTSTGHSTQLSEALGSTNLACWDEAISIVPGIDLHDCAARTRTLLHQYGCVRVRWGTKLASVEEPVPAAVSLLQGTLAHLIKIFASLPPWRDVTVRTDRPPNRSEGTGHLPLHLDFVNTEYPPEFIFFFCVRPDPAGGGASLLVDYSNVVSALPESTRFHLAEPIYRDGTVNNLYEVGRDMNPFPVFSPDAAWPFRYTGHLLTADLPQHNRNAILMLDELLKSRQQIVNLAPGDLLILDQRRILHGRQSLNPGQENIPPNERRLLRQAFGRPSLNL